MQKDLNLLTFHLIPVQKNMLLLLFRAELTDGLLVLLITLCKIVHAWVHVSKLKMSFSYVHKFVFWYFVI
jgi:hypothetical protein